MHRVRPVTRVSNACDRCRKHKQRCDNVRPCANCTHARSECTSSELPPPVKKLRLSRKAESEDRGSVAQRPLINLRPASRLSDLPLDSTFRYGASEPQAGHSRRTPGAERASTSNAASEPSRAQSVFADLGGSESAMDITKKILGYAGSPSATDRATFAIPGGNSNRTLGANSRSGRLLPISEMVGVDLPSREICDALVDTYFYTVHWFSLVLYEPKFRQRYTTIMDRETAYPADRAFLLLLLMVMVMACWYGSGLLPPEAGSTVDLANMRQAFLKVVSQSFMDLIDEDSLEFVQLSALLGSYWLYWGRPRSAFSILGAATKSAQAIELHRDLDMRLSLQDAEERKRVWWTVYTWDRFATIIYGRPLSINDKDCNVSMPASYSEDVIFAPGHEPARVCLSPYQTQLNRVYQIASPILEDIYGIRYSNDRSLRSQMPAMVSKIDQLMRAWQDELPPHLHLEKHDDISSTSSIEEKMHRLQGLSLQLTYDNLMIVIHRPLLADQSHRRCWSRKNISLQPVEPAEDDPPPQTTTSAHHLGFQQCLNSALRISRVQQSKRNLVALARRTHLVSFLGMNLFTSSIVMFICALSDTLSDVAQEAKRGLARNLKVLKLLSGDGSLSMQCSIILEDLVQKIIDKEKEEMLYSLPSDDDVALFLQSRRSSYVDGHHLFASVGTSSQATRPTNDGLERAHEGNGLNESLPDDESVSLKQTMASLQKVFKDVAIPRSQLPCTASEPPLSTHNLPQYSQIHQVQPAGTVPENESFTFDGSNFNTEDLGQYWLWSMDPHIGDRGRWQSGDEYM